LLSGAPITGDTLFDGATFSNNAWFGDATFSRSAEFGGATFTRDVRFRKATFSGGAVLRCRATEIDVGGAQIAGELTIEAVARRIQAQRLRGPGQVMLRVRAAEIDLSGAACSGPVTVHTLYDPINELAGEQVGNADPKADADLPRASVVSLRGADLDQLVLTDVDLRRCLFAGMRGIEKIRLDGRCTFARASRGSRQVLAEESRWRANRSARRHTVWTRTPEPAGIEEVTRARLEVIYRQLRAAVEGAKNEPGAADFYYGEMEMRRLDRTAPWPERAIVTAYWLLSGYGLRATRSITALLVMIGVATAGFAQFGFAPSTTVSYRPLPHPAGTTPTYTEADISGPKPGWATALYHSIDSTTSLLHAPGTETLTPTGRAIEITLRLLGPLLLGLAILAVRGRVKR
jgi:uncharacterized protein YjbI with pentapeptide repeats